jgi:hypothetical protein
MGKMMGRGMAMRRMIPQLDPSAGGRQMADTGWVVFEVFQWAFCLLDNLL